MSKQEIAETSSAFPTTWIAPEQAQLRDFHASTQAMGNPGKMGQLISVLLRLGELQVPVTLRQCGGPDAYYDKKAKSITICYEYLAEVNRLLGKPLAKQFQVDDDTSAALAFTALHEIAHALIHTLGLRFQSNEEDVADRFAILLLLRSGDKDLASKFVQSPAAFFRQHGQEMRAAGGHRVNDTHSSSAKRAQDALCLLYGRFPDAALASTLGTRAATCAQWGEAARREWNEQLRGYSRVQSGETL